MQDHFGDNHIGTLFPVRPQADLGHCGECGNPLLFASELPRRTCAVCDQDNYCGVKGGLNMIFVAFVCAVCALLGAAVIAASVLM